MSRQTGNAPPSLSSTSRQSSKLQAGVRPSNTKDQGPTVQISAPPSQSSPTKADPRDPAGHFSHEFDLIDTDHDNYLSHEELRKGLISQNWDQREVDELFSLIDLSKDVKISKEQFISFRGSIVFDAFAVRTAHNRATLSSKDSKPLDPKSRDLIARNSVSFFTSEPPSPNARRDPEPASPTVRRDQPPAASCIS